MADLPIRLTCADYARVMPLAVGAVKPDGIALTMVLGREGSWPARAEMLRRAASDPTVHGGESSMAGHLRRIDQIAASWRYRCSRCATSPGGIFMCARTAR